MRVALYLLQIPSMLIVLYLDVLSVAAVVWRRSPPPASRRRRFAILIPAHDEEVLLPRALRSIAELDYPHSLYDVHVVADNCTDHTAALAAAHGAMVHERRNERLVGKGYALSWLLSRLQGGDHSYDAYVVVDADSVVSANFLQVMNRCLERGDTVIQAYYGALNRDETWSTALRYAALALFNGLRPRGRDALGLSAGLHGNGMCFRSDILDRFGWAAFALAEDAEFHLTLIEAGLNVSYSPEATVLAEMPVTLSQAKSQNLRWERGRLQMVRDRARHLLWTGIRQGNVRQLDAVTEQLIPPLSVLSGGTVMALLLTTLARVRGPRRLAMAVLLGQVGYVMTGLLLVRAEPRIYLSLLRAPLWMVWKLWVYLSAASRIGDSEWIRTTRLPGATPGSEHMSSAAVQTGSLREA